MKLSLCLIVVSLIAIAASAQPADPYTWAGVGPMVTARADACAVLLQDGRALVNGAVGSDGDALTSAEFFTWPVLTYYSTALRSPKTAVPIRLNPFSKKSRHPPLIFARVGAGKSMEDLMPGQRLCAIPNLFLAAEM